MFYRIVLSTFILCSSSFISVNCMQAPQETKVWIKNDTEKEVTIVYQLRNQKNPVRFDVEPRKIRQIVDDADNLVLLKVAPYGRGWQYLSVEKITLGLLETENLAVRIQDVRRQAPHRLHIILEIKLKPGILGPVKSYDYPISAQDQDPSLEKQRKIPFSLSLFPKVTAAFQARKKIEPRYFLNLPEHVTNDDIQMRYEQLMREWQPKLPATNKNSRDYTKDDFIAKEAVKFINAAYQALMFPLRNQETFYRLVEEEIETPTVLQ